MTKLKLTARKLFFVCSYVSAEATQGGFGIRSEMGPVGICRREDAEDTRPLTVESIVLSEKAMLSIVYVERSTTRDGCRFR